MFGGQGWFGPVISAIGLLVAAAVSPIAGLFALILMFVAKILAAVGFVFGSVAAVFAFILELFLAVTKVFASVGG